MMDRRSFLKTSAAGSLGTLGSMNALSSLGASSRAEVDLTERPNIVLIMADDMGFSDIGSYGGEIDTPHLDRLAEGGMRFTQFYNAARCCPTRASLMTGLYPHQAGVGHMRADLGLPAYRGHLNDRSVTIASLLGRAGYNTAMSGKWHLGQAYDQQPLGRGFERYTGLLDGASHYFDPPPSRALYRDNKPFAPKSVDYFASRDGLQPDFYMTDFFSRWGERYVRELSREKAPFFLYLSYTAPHWPLHARPEDIEKYERVYRQGWDQLRRARYERQRTTGLIPEKWGLPPRASGIPAWEEVEDKNLWAQRMAVYAAMVDRMDQGIGRVLQALEDGGEWDNTLVLFLSDNGGSPEGLNKSEDVPPGGPDSYESYHRPWASLSDVPFRRYKRWVHEGGIATPLIAHWPSRIEASTMTRERGHVMDIMATCLEVAGVTYPDQYEGHTLTPMAGKSLVPVFEGHPRVGHDALYWAHMDNHAVQGERWKLVSSNGMQEWALYDMVRDRTELHDRAGEHPALVRRLAGQYQRWADRVGVLPWKRYRALRKKQRDNS